MSFVAALAALAWVYLALLHGKFWQAGPILPAARPSVAPAVDVVVPARDEVDAIAASLGSLLAQDFAGSFRVVLVDDGSADGTGEVARALGDPRLTVLEGAARPAGWAGKLWAVWQGVAATDAPWLLLTDADIVHEPAHLSALVAQAERGGADLVSEMVELACESRAERALVPAFVYFFQLLYPFARVNDTNSGVAAAAGGTMLVRRAALERIGGIEAIRGALIDDVALAQAVKRGGLIWLGHSALARSVRPYPGFSDIYRMVARSAYVQLRYSPLLLAGTLLGLALLFLLPPVAALFCAGPARWLGLFAWVTMAVTFWPTLRKFRLSPLRALLLPAMAAFYMAATLGSALDHHCGRGVVWKRRAYAERDA
jgi:hopene-associated glycosyltransferase HpnB